MSETNIDISLAEEYSAFCLKILLRTDFFTIIFSIVNIFTHAIVQLEVGKIIQIKHMTDAASDANRPDRVKISHVKGTVSRQTIQSILFFLNSRISREELIRNFNIDGVDPKVAEVFIQVIHNTSIQSWTDFFRGLANSRNFIVRLEPNYSGKRITDVHVDVAARSSLT